MPQKMLTEYSDASACAYLFIFWDVPTSSNEEKKTIQELNRILQLKYRTRESNGKNSR